MFDRQLQVQIRQNDVVLAAPVETKVRKHQDYTNTIYVYIGSRDLFTLSNGHIYGEALEELTDPETERLARKNRIRVLGSAAKCIRYICRVPRKAMPERRAL